LILSTRDIRIASLSAKFQVPEPVKVIYDHPH